MPVNHIQLNLDLNTAVGVKTLLAIASAFGDDDQPVGCVEVQVNNPPRESTEHPLLRGEVADAAPEATPNADAPVKRRRTKAQIKEDRVEGLEDAFKKAAKEHPDLDVDTIRDMIRGNREAEAAEVADDVPAWDADAAPPEISSASDTDDAPEPAWGGGVVADEENDWQPNWGA